MSDAHAASSSASADPAWFTQLVSPPASVENVAEPVSEPPVDSGEPAPVVETESVEAPPATELPSELSPAPDPEVERLKRQVAEYEQEKAKAEQEAQRAKAQAERLESRSQFFARVKE